jgi:uncharacterized protein VirK/YbjX
MKSLWKHLSGLFSQRSKTDGALSAALVCAGAIGTLLLDRQHRELLRLEIVDKYIAESDDPDVLFHISHRHYLSRTFTRRERVDCALTHYRYESEHHDARYKDAVYRGDGLRLWARTVAGVAYVMKLRATTDLRHEGGLSIVMHAGDTWLCEMSFSWVDPRIFGLDTGIVPFITRNQSIRFDAPALRLFRAHFPQNSPPYFCFAAMHGVAAFHGMTRIAGIKHDCQVAFEERYASGFRNSYCEFWKSFGAVELGRLAYLMPVPLSAPPISKVSARHRQRAIDRRRHWAEILQDTQTALEQASRPEPRVAGVDAGHGRPAAATGWQLPALTR